MQIDKVHICGPAITTSKNPPTTWFNSLQYSNVEVQEHTKNGNLVEKNRRRLIPTQFIADLKVTYFIRQSPFDCFIIISVQI